MKVHDIKIKPFLRKRKKFLRFDFQCLIVLSCVVVASLADHAPAHPHAAPYHPAPAPYHPAPAPAYHQPAPYHAPAPAYHKPIPGNTKDAFILVVTQNITPYLEHEWCCS